MSRRDKIAARVWFPLLVGTLAVAVGLLIYALVPGPKVKVVGEPFIVGSAVIEVGGTVVWERQEVCVPPGLTEVFRYAEQLDEADPRLQVEFEIPGFDINASEEVCFNPSITPILIPNYIGPGEYRIKIVTKTSAFGNKTTSSESFGPSFTVVAPSD